MATDNDSESKGKAFLQLEQEEAAHNAIKWISDIKMYVQFIIKKERASNWCARVH